MRLLTTACLAAIVMAAMPAATYAGDYSHTCRTADGMFEMHDEQLYVSSTYGQSDQSIPYRKISEKVLSQEIGYCLSNEARGQRFSFEYKTYVLKIAFKYDGQDFETDAICELAASGLPAMYNCDRTEVTQSKNTTSPPPAQSSGPSMWTHNGSIVALSANGATRTFTYEVPRKGIRNVGVKPGTLLFRGERQGPAYSGRAYIFSKNCEPAPYDVVGVVSDDERSITLRGSAPRVASDCSIKGYRDDVLKFNYVSAGG